MLKIGILGAKGRMGEMIKACLLEEKEASLGFGYDLGDDFKDLFDASDVIIDFSTPSGTKELLKYAKNHAKPLVIGTTGLCKETENELLSLSKTLPILYASNMSLGVAVLKKLVFEAAKLLKDYDCEILEMHHHHKIDAPSGTAMTLAKCVAKARELDLEKVRISARDGQIGPRKKDEIGVMSLRGGDVAGRHRVGFYGIGEYLELTHNASSRMTFAKGAIKAALFLASKGPGLYGIDDALGL